MGIQSAVVRARRGMREEAGLHVVALSSLTIAFMCLGTALLAMTNLDALADSWGRSGRMTVFLRDGTVPGDVEQLRMALEGLPEVTSVAALSAEEARTRFLRDTDLGADLSSLPADAFPASLELALAAGTSAARVEAISTRLRRFRAVDDVESYRGWFERLERLLAAGRSLSLGLALLVAGCVVLVIGNTIRLAVAGRRQEIEVMRLCGASHGFVCGPFIVEGAAQGFLSALLAVGLLLGGFIGLRAQFDVALSGMAGLDAVFLSPAVALTFVLGGGLLGAAGSLLSLRRYMAV